MRYTCRRRAVSNNRKRERDAPAFNLRLMDATYLGGFMRTPYP